MFCSVLLRAYIREQTGSAESQKMKQLKEQILSCYWYNTKLQQNSVKFKQMKTV